MHSQNDQVDHEFLELPDGEGEGEGEGDRDIERDILDTPQSFSDSSVSASEVEDPSGAIRHAQVPRNGLDQLVDDLDFNPKTNDRMECALSLKQGQANEGEDGEEHHQQEHHRQEHQQLGDFMRSEEIPSASNELRNNDGVGDPLLRPSRSLREYHYSTSSATSICDTSSTSRRSGRTCCRCTARERTRLTCFISFVLFLVSGFLFVLYFLLVPAIAQLSMNQGVLQVVNMEMSSPTHDTVFLNASLELHDVATVRAHISSTNVSLSHQGSLLASMEIPRVDLVPGRKTSFQVLSALHVHDVQAFTDATADILKGIGGIWVIEGEIELHLHLFAGLEMRAPLKMQKGLPIPPTLLRDVRGYNSTIIPNQSTPNTLAINAYTSFFSSSILELKHMNMFVFKLMVPSITNRKHGDKGEGEEEDGEDEHTGFPDETKLVEIAEVTLNDFQVRRGVNIMPISAKLLKTSENEDDLSQFLSTFIQGINQVALLKGPIKSVSPFLTDVVQLDIVFEGLRDHEFVRMALIDKQTMAGHKVKLPDSNKVVNYRGAMAATRNSFTVELLQENFVMDVFLDTPIGYKLKHSLFGNWVCPKSDNMVRLQTLPGMNLFNASASPQITMDPLSLNSVFLPGEPMPGQLRQKPCTVLGVRVAGDYDCCFVTLQPAVACYARSRREVHFSTHVNGSFRLTIDRAFTVPNIQLRQKQVPVAYTEEITDGYLADGELTCDMFEFY